MSNLTDLIGRNNKILIGSESQRTRYFTSPFFKSPIKYDYERSPVADGRHELKWVETESWCESMLLKMAEITVDIEDVDQGKEWGTSLSGNREYLGDGTMGRTVHLFTSGSVKAAMLFMLVLADQEGNELAIKKIRDCGVTSTIEEAKGFFEKEIPLMDGRSHYYVNTGIGDFSPLSLL